MKSTSNGKPYQNNKVEHLNNHVRPNFKLKLKDAKQIRMKTTAIGRQPQY